VSTRRRLKNHNRGTNRSIIHALPTTFRVCVTVILIWLYILVAGAPPSAIHHQGSRHALACSVSHEEAEVSVL
jgi:hypothetical protein